jgi:AcrR family transcriptional regulator
MTRDKSPPPLPKPSTRERVLDAAERLLSREGNAAFSMRDLAEEAGLSFATPFNQFGGKIAIMRALSARLIAKMRDQLSQATLPEHAAARVLLAVDIATSVMLAASSVNRVVMGTIGSPSDDPGDVLARSGELWAEALGVGEGLAFATRAAALTVLPDHLAVAFRGVLSFWTAGEIDDAELPKRARAAAAAVLLGFIGREGRADLLAMLGA